MDELLVIISTELILLASIAVMTIRHRRTDVLNQRRSDAAGCAVVDGNRSDLVRRRVERERLRPASREITESPSTSRQPRRSTPPHRTDTGDTADGLPEKHSLHAPRPAWLAGDRKNAPTPSGREPASLPHDTRIYAIGDIHGRADLLGRLLRRIEADCRERPAQRALTVFIGDYIDRGSHSRDVIDLLLRWRKDNDAIFLKGNHETFLPRFLSDSKTLQEWRKCGGLETLLSYGLQPSISPDRDEQERLANQLANSLPKEHFDFLESLEPFYCCGDFFFVHAGIRPGIPMDEQAEEDLLWIREEFLDHEQPFERLVIHGHTPVEAVDIRSNRINIDTGAFATGRLACIVIEGSAITELPEAMEAGALTVP